MGTWATEEYATNNLFTPKLLAHDQGVKLNNYPHPSRLGSGEEW